MVYIWLPGLMVGLAEHHWLPMYKTKFGTSTTICIYVNVNDHYDDDDDDDYDHDDANNARADWCNVFILAQIYISNRKKFFPLNCLSKEINQATQKGYFLCLY